MLLLVWCAQLTAAGILVLTTAWPASRPATRWVRLACGAAALALLALFIGYAIQAVWEHFHPEPPKSAFSMLSEYMDPFRREFHWTHLLPILDDLLRLFLYAVLLICMIGLWRQQRRANLVIATAIVVSIPLSLNAIYLVRDTCSVLADVGLPLFGRIEDLISILTRHYFLIALLRELPFAIYLMVSSILAFQLSRQPRTGAFEVIAS